MSRLQGELAFKEGRTNVKDFFKTIATELTANDWAPLTRTSSPDDPFSFGPGRTIKIPKIVKESDIRLRASIAETNLVNSEFPFGIINILQGSEESKTNVNCVITINDTKISVPIPPKKTIQEIQEILFTQITKQFDSLYATSEKIGTNGIKVKGKVAVKNITLSTSEQNVENGILVRTRDESKTKRLHLQLLGNLFNTTRKGEMVKLKYGLQLADVRGDKEFTVTIDTSQDPVYPQNLDEGAPFINTKILEAFKAAESQLTDAGVKINILSAPSPKSGEQALIEFYCPEHDIIGIVDKTNDTGEGNLVSEYKLATKSSMTKEKITIEFLTTFFKETSELKFYIKDEEESATEYSVIVEQYSSMDKVVEGFKKALQEVSKYNYRVVRDKNIIRIDRTEAGSSSSVVNFEQTKLLQGHALCSTDFDDSDPNLNKRKLIVQKKVGISGGSKRIYTLLGSALKDFKITPMINGAYVTEDDTMQSIDVSEGDKPSDIVTKLIELMKTNIDWAKIVKSIPEDPASIRFENDDNSTDRFIFNTIAFNGTNSTERAGMITTNGVDEPKIYKGEIIITKALKVDTDFKIKINNTDSFNVSIKGEKKTQTPEDIAKTIAETISVAEEYTAEAVKNKVSIVNSRVSVDEIFIEKILIDNEKVKRYKLTGNIIRGVGDRGYGTDGGDNVFIETRDPGILFDKVSLREGTVEGETQYFATLISRPKGKVRIFKARTEAIQQHEQAIQRNPGEPIFSLNGKNLSRSSANAIKLYIGRKPILTEEEKRQEHNTGGLETSKDIQYIPITSAVQFKVDYDNGLIFLENDPTEPEKAMQLCLETDIRMKTYGEKKRSEITAEVRREQAKKYEIFLAVDYAVITNDIEGDEIPSSICQVMDDKVYYVGPRELETAEGTIGSTVNETWKKYHDADLIITVNYKWNLVYPNDISSFDSIGIDRNKMIVKTKIDISQVKNKSMFKEYFLEFRYNDDPEQRVTGVDVRMGTKLKTETNSLDEDHCSTWGRLAWYKKDSAKLLHLTEKMNLSFFMNYTNEYLNLIVQGPAAYDNDYTHYLISPLMFGMLDKYEGAIYTEDTYNAYFTVGGDLFPETGEKWGENTGNGVTDIVVDATISNVPYQAHYPSFHTVPEFMQKHYVNVSTETAAEQVGEVIIYHPVEKARGKIQGVLVGDRSTIEHLGILVENRDTYDLSGALLNADKKKTNECGGPNVSKEKTYVQINLNSPYSMFNNSPNVFYGMCMRKA